MAKKNAGSEGEAKDKGKLPVAVGVGTAVAAASLVHPIIAVIAGGLAPVVSDKIHEAMMRRAERFRGELAAEGVDFEKMGETGEALSNAQVDLIREAIESVLRTDSDEKVQLIARLLRAGLDAPGDSEVMTAKRFARTIGRIDELEFRVVMSWRQGNSDLKERGIKEVSRASGVANLDLVRTALSILGSEGLVRSKSGNVEKWELTDFGHRFLVGLAALDRGLQADEHPK